MLPALVKNPPNHSSLVNIIFFNCLWLMFLLPTKNTLFTIDLLPSFIFKIAEGLVSSGEVLNSQDISGL